MMKPMASEQGREQVATYIAHWIESAIVESVMRLRCLPGSVDHSLPVSRQKSSNFPYLDMAGYSGARSLACRAEPLGSDGRISKCCSAGDSERCAYPR